MTTQDELRAVYGIVEDTEDIYVDDRILSVVNSASRLLKLMHTACRITGDTFEDSKWLNRSMIDNWNECQRLLIIHVIEAHNVFLSYRSVNGLVGISVWSSGAHYLLDKATTKVINLESSDDVLLQEIISVCFGK